MFAVRIDNVAFHLFCACWGCEVKHKRVIGITLSRPLVMLLAYPYYSPTWESMQLLYTLSAIWYLTSSWKSNAKIDLKSVDNSPLIVRSLNFSLYSLNKEAPWEGLQAHQTMQSHNLEEGTSHAASFTANGTTNLLKLLFKSTPQDACTALHLFLDKLDLQTIRHRVLPRAVLKDGDPIAKL